MDTKTRSALLLSFLLPTLATAASPEKYPWGQAGDPARATRTIAVDMSDALRFTPSRVKVTQGETIRFVVANSGKVMHEMVIGTEEELLKHAEMMKKYPGMKHHEPYMAHVSPGRRGTLAWTFTQPGTFTFGCLVPGHWDGGMKGTIVVTAR